MGNTNEIKKKNRPKRGDIRHNAEIKEKALKMYAKGYTTKEIAVLLSCKECTLKFWAKKYHGLATERIVKIYTKSPVTNNPVCINASAKSIPPPSRITHDYSDLLSCFIELLNSFRGKDIQFANSSSS